MNDDERLALVAQLAKDADIAGLVVFAKLDDESAEGDVTLFHAGSTKHGDEWAKLFCQTLAAIHPMINKMFDEQS